MKNLSIAIAILGIVFVVLGVVIKIVPAFNFLNLKQISVYVTFGTAFLVLSLVIDSLFKK